MGRKERVVCATVEWTMETHHRRETLGFTPLTGISRVFSDWFGTANAKILYDSDVDEFCSATFARHILSRDNVAVVATTDDGDVFGGICAAAVTSLFTQHVDPSICLFSFESHGRCPTPARFPQARPEDNPAFVEVWKNDQRGFLAFGGVSGGFVCVGDERLYSCADSLADAFEGLDNTTLTGATGFGVYVHFRRLLVIQLC